MNSLLQLLLYTCLFKEIFSKRDYLLENPDEQLRYCTSSVFPKQLSAVNSASQIGVVVDSENERIAILNGETESGMIFDKRLKLGFQVDQGGWNMYQQSLEEYLKDANISLLVDQNYGTAFELDDHGAASEAAVQVQTNLEHFSPTFVEEIVGLGGSFLEGVLTVFGYIMYPIKTLLGPLLNMLSPVWEKFKGGFMALINIIRWMGKLVSNVAGGLGLLAKAGVVFTLNLIIGAVDGAKAFFIMLKEIALHLDLITILKLVVTVPLQIAKFIVGLGGKVLRGVTGIFTIIARLFTFSIFKVASAIKGLTEMVLDFLSGDRISFETVQSSCDELLQIPQIQNQQFNNIEQFAEYQNFVKGVKGEGNFNIKGVEVGPIVKLVTQTATTAKTILMGVMKSINPMVPFNVAVPSLLVNTIKSLNTTKGPSYVTRLFPNVKVPHGGLAEAGSVWRSSSSEESIEELVDLAAPDLLRKLPIVGDIYVELDDAAQYYGNRSLDSMLESHHAGELVEFTTKALGLR